MTGTISLTIGAAASCTDGACGTVSRLVIDPAARTVTHLVIDRHDQGRLVPLGLVGATASGIRLRCTLAQFENLDPADKTVLPHGSFQDPRWGHDVLGLRRGPGVPPPPVTLDALPFAEVDVHGGEHVHATDGDIGQLHGLGIDPASHQVTHVLLQEGHLRGRKKVAIPISAVTRVASDGIQLSITKQRVQNLPPADMDHPEG